MHPLRSHRLPPVAASWSVMDWSQLLEELSRGLTALPFVLAAIIILWMGRWLFRWTITFGPENDATDDSNPAAGIVYGCFILSLAVAVAGTFFGRHEDDVLLALAKMFGEAALIVVLLRISIWVNDHFILHRFSIAKEIRDDRNMGAAFCVAGSSLACGLVLNGAMIGFSADYPTGLRDIAIFWLVGQSALVLGGYLHQLTSQFDVHQLIEYDDNVAVGLEFGGFLVSLGIVLRGALVGATSQNLGQEVLQAFLLALLAVVLIVTFRSTVVWLLLPRVDETEEVEMNGNIAVAIVGTLVSLAVAVLLATAIQR